MAIADLAVLDGRYQLLRRLGGQARSPLMVASDLRRGTVVCLRLRRFSAAMASLAVVPPLSAPRQPGEDGPLLPYDFGVDADVAYLVRDYVAGTTLEQALAAPAPPSPREIVGILRRAGEALLAAEAEGFTHPGLLPEHVLVAADGSVRLTGFDALDPATPTPLPRGSRGLRGVLRAALAGQDPALPPAVRPYLGRPGRRGTAADPELADLVRALARCEAALDGRTAASGIGDALRRAAPAGIARLRHLGPLLHPYAVLLGLLAAVAVAAAGHRSVGAAADRVYVYTVPAATSSAVPAEAAPPGSATAATGAPTVAAAATAAVTPVPTTPAPSAVVVAPASRAPAAEPAAPPAAPAVPAPPPALPPAPAERAARASGNPRDAALAPPILARAAESRAAPRTVEAGPAGAGRVAAARPERTATSARVAATSTNAESSTARREATAATRPGAVRTTATATRTMATATQVTSRTITTTAATTRRPD